MTKFQRLTVKDFQSIASLDVDLGDFTVVVGSSNSGKSALLRALKAVVRNVGSPAAVRVGAKNFVVRLGFGDEAVVLERGKSSSTYRVIKSDSEDVYAKAGRSVPAEIQQVLGMPEPEGPDLIFSSQIDPPFLLAETGSTAAKLFGDLTNVSRLHAAAREANRRKSEATKVHKIRTEDAIACAQRMKTEFSGLREEVTLVKETKAALGNLRATATRLDRLREIQSDLTMLDSALAKVEEQKQSLPQAADIESDLADLGRRLGEYRQILDLETEIEDLDEKIKSVRTKAKETVRQAEELDEKLAQALRVAGVCPTCGREIDA